MNEENIKRAPKKHIRNVPVSIKISKHLSDFLREKNYSPTGVFLEACRKLGYKEQ